MATKSEILEAIKRTARANGGAPLGAARFQRETGMSSWDWEQHWARFGDAVTEAGFKPNKFQAAHSDEFLAEKLAAIVRKLGKFPTYREIEVERRADPEMPNKKVFQRVGSKERLAKLVSEYCSRSPGHDDVVAHCAKVVSGNGTMQADEQNIDVEFGEVYLFKSGRYYKIGRTNNTVRRGHEIRVQLPERMTLIHSIKTDDPSGIEAYWHQRFETKRMKGEWFDLNSADVKAFKQWRKIS